MRLIGLVEQGRQGDQPQQRKRRRERGQDPAAPYDLPQGPPGPFSFVGDGLAADVGVRPGMHVRSAIDATGGAR